MKKTIHFIARIAASWTGISFLLLSCNAFSLNATPMGSLEMCKNRFCTEDMKRIFDEYQSTSSSLPTGSQAYSGECYYIHPNLSPERTHHGVILLESTEPSQLPSRFSGLFSYFTNENPYKDKNFYEIQKIVQQGSPHPKVLKNLEDESRVIITPEGSPIYYWLKFTSSKALLMSLWTFDNNPVDYRIFCELNVKVTKE